MPTESRRRTCLIDLSLYPLQRFFFFCDRKLSSNRIASLPERVFAALINLKRLWVKLYYIVFKMTLCAKPSFLIRGSVRVYAVAFWHRIAYFICLQRANCYAKYFCLYGISYKWIVISLIICFHFNIPIYFFIYSGIYLQPWFPLYLIKYLPT